MVSGGSRNGIANTTGFNGGVSDSSGGWSQQQRFGDHQDRPPNRKQFTKTDGDDKRATLLRYGIIQMSVPAGRGTFTQIWLRFVKCRPATLKSGK
jgi:hypothetical protein